MFSLSLATRTQPPSFGLQGLHSARNLRAFVYKSYTQKTISKLWYTSLKPRKQHTSLSIQVTHPEPNLPALINRPGLAGAVLQKPLLLSRSVGHSL